MVNLSKEECCACAACENICPKSAISFKEDEYGYKYPNIDVLRCVDCGLCDNICPVLSPVSRNSPQNIYAAKSIEQERCTESASGGFVASLAESIIKDGGIVYGCYAENYQAIGHIRIDNVDDLGKIKNSKYVQSDIRYTYQETLADLKQNIFVLFIGTPCQIAGLRSFIRKEYKNLLTCDFVCHGVPSLKMLKDQVESYSIVRKYKPENINIDFRWKVESEGASKVVYGLRIWGINDDGKKIKLKEENSFVNPYARCFQTGISLRENCLHCQYTSTNRVSDITCADFWGLGDVVKSSMNVFSGVSLVLVNTQQGKEYFERIKANFLIEEHPIEDATRMNRCLSAPFPRLSQRDYFLELYKNQGLIIAAKKTDLFHRFESNKVIQIMRKTHIGSVVVYFLLKFLKH